VKEMNVLEGVRFWFSIWCIDGGIENWRLH